jgi:tetratricopeptide (TPR) repeat protein
MAESRLKPLPQRRLWAALAVLAAVTAGCGSGGTKPDAAAAMAAGPDPAVVARYEAALAMLQAGDDRQAEAQLQALVDTCPDYAGPMVNLAMIRARRNEIEPATALLQRAVGVCDRCAPSWNELGVLQRRQGRFSDAEQSYLKAIAADAGYANAYFNLGVLYELYLQRPELALAHYGRFRELQVADPAGGDVDKWIADLKRRTKAVERSAQLEVPQS